MNRLVFYIVLLLGLASCGMQKQVVSQDVQADVKTSADDSTALAKKIESIVRAQVDEMLDKKIENDLVIERTTWSPPDTAGNQYIVSEERVKSETRVTETKKATRTDVAEVTEETDSTSVSASVEDLVVDTKTQIASKDGLPWWQMTLMVIGAVVLIMIGIKIVLKFV